MPKYGFKVAAGLDSAVSKLHKKAIAALGENMTPDEQVRVVIHGVSAQAIVGTARRVFVFKKGMLAGATFGSELTSWEYRNIVGVQIHTGMMSGAVILQGPGQTGAKTSYWGNSDDDPHKAPNAIPLARPFDEAKRGVAELRKLISSSHQPQTHSPSVHVSSGGNTQGSMADELVKLAELRASGVLNDSEFESLKARLLGG